jgi:dimethylhistidine N-methyltransferase
MHASPELAAGRAATHAAFHDAARTAQPPASRFAHDVLEGLARRRRSIPCRWLYDHRGSQLFEQIAAVPEYYPTRTEVALLQQCAAAIAEAAGSGAALIELGSGSSRKTPLVLGALPRPALYMPIDLAEASVAEAATLLAARFPAVEVRPLVADFTTLDSLPLPAATGRRVVFFPGGTIGNLTPEDASQLLERLGRLVGLGALLVVGVDHTRDPAALVAAYDDRAGITAAFNLNLLRRINRELQGDFDLAGFAHRACFDAAEPRVEMHLVATRAQRVHVLGQAFDFAAGESIHTENAYKPSLFQFLALAHRAGWAQRQLWMGAAAGYAVHVLENVLAV